MKKIYFDIQTTGKSSRDRNLMKNYYNKRALLASGVQEVNLLSENAIELCDRLQLINQEKQTGNNNNRFDKEMIAIFDKILEHKCITSTQHKKSIKKSNLL